MGCAMELRKILIPVFLFWVYVLNVQHTFGALPIAYSFPSVTPTSLRYQFQHRGLVSDTLGIEYDTLRSRIQTEVKQQKSAGENRRIQQAVEVIMEMQGAIEALQKGKSAVALDSLNKAQKKLHFLLQHYPDLKLLPVDVAVEVIHLAVGPDTIKAARELVKKLIDRGELQAARRLLDNLVSEIRVTTTYLPMEVFPKPVQQAKQLIQRKEINRARQILEKTLAMLETKEYAIPLPVIIAESLVSAATAIADSSQNVARHMLTNARKQLEIAQLLGYRMNKRQYQNIITQINQLQRALQQGEKTKARFHQLQEDIHRFKAKFEKLSG